MYLYLYNFEKQNKDKQSGYPQKSSSDFSEKMVRKALNDYVFRQRITLTAEELKQIEIRRSDKGKPYFAELNSEIHFSVSHSGDWWGCLMADEPIGFDLEVCREKVNYEKISKRFFTEEEYEFVLSAGLEGFFEMWVRKEAYVKYIGSGLAEGLNSFMVIQNGDFSPCVIVKKDVKSQTELQSQPLLQSQSPPCAIGFCHIQHGVKAAYCSGSGNPINEIIIMKGSKYEAK